MINNRKFNQDLCQFLVPFLPLSASLGIFCYLGIFEPIVVNVGLLFAELLSKSNFDSTEFDSFHYLTLMAIQICLKKMHVRYNANRNYHIKRITKVTGFYRQWIFFTKNIHFLHFNVPKQINEFPQAKN